MNPYTAQQLARQRTAEFRAEAARRRTRPGARRHPIRHHTGWALVQIGLALITSAARRQHHAAVRPQLP